jgi:hypothetical protein
LKSAIDGQAYVEACPDGDSGNPSIFVFDSLVASDMCNALVTCTGTEHAIEFPTFVLSTDYEDPMNARSLRGVFPCTLLTADQGHSIKKTSVVLAILRGLTRFDDIDDVFLRAAQHFLKTKDMHRATVFVEEIRHRPYRNDVRESVLVVTVEKATPMEQVMDMRRRLGVDKSAKYAIVDVMGVRLVLYADYADFKNTPIPASVKTKKRHVQISNISDSASRDDIKNAVFRAFDHRFVDYWTVRQTQRNRLRVLVGLTPSFQHGDNPSLPWYELQAFPRVPRYMEYNIPLPRRPEAEEVIAADASTSRLRELTSRLNAPIRAAPVAQASKSTGQPSTNQSSRRQSKP